MSLPASAGLDNEPAVSGNGAMLTVQLLTDSYLQHLAVRVKCGQSEPATLAWYRSQLDKLAAAAGKFPAADLRAHHLIGVEFTHHFVRALKALYRWAVDEDVGLVPRDPFRKLVAPPCGERQRVLSRTEMTALYRAGSRSFRRFLFVLSHTIARPGEIRALRWCDVNWDRRLIVLHKFKGKKKRRDGVKVRTIPLDWPTVRLLRNLHRRAVNPKPDDQVWIGRGGEPWTANAVRCQMRRVRKRAGLGADGEGERVVCYTLRHTGATNATRAGVVDNTLAKVMGHARTATTNRYQHLAGEDLVEAIDRVSARPRRKAQ